MQNTNMRTDIQKPETITSAETSAEIELWLNQVQGKCVGEIASINLVSGSCHKAKELNLALPLILTLCPAVFNLNFPTANGQTRELVPIQSNSPRVRSLFEEIFGFQIFLKKNLNMNADMFIIFGDSLERGSDKMLTNPQDMASISEMSIKSIRETIIDIDRSTNGLFQKSGIKVPKIRLQSNISQQGGKVGLNRETIINQAETAILDPNSNLFALWSKHLLLARNDSKFTETSWQGLKSAEAIWSRMRFLIAELTADGIFLPEMMKHLTMQNEIEPIFLASSTRKVTLEMEADCFNIKRRSALIPAFRNIGKWLNPAESSPWIDELRNV